MSGIIEKSVVPVAQAPVPAARNRVCATFSPLPEGDFQDIATVIQPVFQSAGFAPELLMRPPGAGFRLSRQTLSYTGPYEVLCLSQMLYRGHEKRASSAVELDAFIKVCEQVAQSITDHMNPKGWFAKRRSSSGVMARPVFPNFDRDRETALGLANHYAKFFATLPAYQKTVKIVVQGTDAHVEELTDFADFAGFPAIVQGNVWYHPGLGAAMMLQDGMLGLTIASVPRTPSPSEVYDNMVEIANRFAMEFGGEVHSNDPLAAQTIQGWINVLAQVGFVPGDEEVREFFPSPIGM